MAETTITPYSVEWLGTIYRILLTAQQTDARLGMFESVDQPGYGPPRHIHHREDETFYVKSGEVEFWTAGKSSFHGAGSTVFMPRGVEHTFRIVGEMPGRMLTVMTPGGFEGFFAEVSQRNCRIPQDMDLLAEIGSRFNLTFTGPPLGTG